MVPPQKRKPRSVGLYLRQSQYLDGSISMEMQEKTVRAMAEREGLRVTGVYRDDDTSGRSTANRPGLRDLRAAYDAGEFDLALAHAVSRFSRDMRDGAEIVAQMPVGSVLEGLQDPDDDFPVLLHMLLAHKQSREIGKRWAELRAYRLAQGLPASGGTRFGYHYTKALVTDERGNTKRTAPEDAYRINEDLAPHVREMYRRYLQGQGFNTITEYLNGSGIGTSKGGAWNVSKVYDYMDKGFSAGLIWDDGQHHPGVHEPIISEQTWTHYLRERKLRRTKSPRERGSTWELQGVAKCALCGGPLSISKNNGARYARCSRYKNAGPSVCTGVSYRVSGLMEQLMLKAGKTAGQFIPDNSEQRAALEAQLSVIEAELEKVSETQEKLAEGWAEGLLDSDGYRRASAAQDERRASLEGSRDDLEIQLADLAPIELEPLPPRKEVPERHREMLRRTGLVLAKFKHDMDAIAELTPPEQARIYRRIFEGVYVSDETVRFVYRSGEAVEEPRLSARHKGVRMRNKTASGVHREVRSWAAAQGIATGGGGALSLDLIERWESATGRDRSVSPVQTVTVSEWSRTPEGQQALSEAGVSYSGKGRPSEAVREMFEKQ